MDHYLILVKVKKTLLHRIFLAQTEPLMISLSLHCFCDFLLSSTWSMYCTLVMLMMVDCSVS